MKSAVFVKYGSFSLVNARVAEILREKFPEVELRVLDAAGDILAKYPAQSLWLRLFCSLRRPVAFLRGRHSPWDFVFRDLLAWRLISRWLAAELQRPGTLFVLQTQSMFDASIAGVPFFIYTDHTHHAHRRQPGGGSPWPASAAWIAAETRLYQRANTVFTLSDFCARSVIEDYAVPPERVLPVYTGSNFALPELIFPLSPRDPVVLFVASQWEIKGGPQLVRAFRQVRQHIPLAELWLVGSRPARLEPGIRAFGRTGREELSDLFSKAAVVCVPSLVERASMVALDAAAHGLPVVISPHGAGAERVRHGETGMIADPDNSQALAAAICKILADPVLAGRLGRAGRNMVEQDLTWKQVGAKMAARIRTVLAA